MTYEELVRDHAGKMIEKLVTDVVSKEAVEVRFEFEDNEQWSVITMHKIMKRIRKFLSGYMRMTSMQPFFRIL